jgi:hypothetical protein
MISPVSGRCSLPFAWSSESEERTPECHGVHRSAGLFNRGSSQAFAVFQPRMTVSGVQGVRESSNDQPATR